MNRLTLQRLALTALCASTVVACDSTSPNFGNPNGNTATDINQNITVYAARNPGAAGTEVDSYSTGNLSGAPTTATTGNNENIALDLSGNLIQASGRSAANVSLKEFCRVGPRLEAGLATSFDDTQLDREIATSGLSAPKGIAIAHKAGRIITTDTGNNSIIIHSVTASEDRSPAAIATNTTLGALATPTNAWDIHYDEANDRLFAALTNGQIAVFDTFLATPTAAPARIVTPADSTGTVFPAPTNLHGIAFDGSRLVVTDVGAGSSATAGFDTDGSIYVFNNTSAFTSGASSNVNVSRVIEGPLSLLGNPVDIALEGDVLRVAEKANGGGQILIFDNIFSGGSGDFAPDATVASAAVESIATRDNTLTTQDVTDIDTTTGLDSVTISNNPAPGGAMTAALEGQISVLNGSTLAAKADININESAVPMTPATRFLENVAYSVTGDMYAAFDDNGTPSTGGIMVINRVDAHAAADAQTNTDLDRVIEGTNTTLVTPKGLELVDAAGTIIVADTGSTPPRLVLFSMCASGDAAPIAVTNLTQAVWDVDYDPSNDRLFAAGTNGEVLVWDDFLANQAGSPMTGVAESRRIRPVPNTPSITSTNLHGIIYDAANDRLVLTDVGSAADATDGRIYTITSAASAAGNTNVGREISGAATNLGNPVDIALNGTVLFVAEKSNDSLMRFDNIFNTQGSDPDTAANVTITVTKPESVSIAPSTLGATP